MVKYVLYKSWSRNWENSPGTQSQLRQIWDEANHLGYHLNKKYSRKHGTRRSPTGMGLEKLSKRGYAVVDRKQTALSIQRMIQILQKKYLIEEPMTIIKKVVK